METEKDSWVGDILRRHDWQVNNPLNASGEVQGRVKGWALGIRTKCLSTEVSVYEGSGMRRGRKRPS